MDYRHLYAVPVLVQNNQWIGMNLCIIQMQFAEERLNIVEIFQSEITEEVSRILQTRERHMVHDNSQTPSLESRSL